MSLEPAEQTSGGFWFWPGIVAGVGIMLYGLQGLMRESNLTHPPNLFVYYLGGAIIHDGLVAPIVTLIGWSLKRFVPKKIWPEVRGVLFAAAVIGLYSWPFVHGYGRRPDNPSILPNNYAVGLVDVLLFVMVIAAGVAIVRARRSRAVAN